MRRIFERAWTGLRDRFSSSVLGTTSANMPGLAGGLSRRARLAICAFAMLLAVAAALAAGKPWGTGFFFPALVVAGVFGGVELAAGALALSIFLTWRLFDPPDLVPFAAAATLQTALGLVGRAFFRESRRWGVRYRKLLGAIASAVTVSDGQGRIGQPHPELSRLIGMDWPTYAGVGWLASIHPDDHKLLTPEGPIGDDTVQRAEIRLKDPVTGDWRWHLMRAVPLTDDDGNTVEEWISTLTDIHDRKLTGEQQAMMIGEARHRLKNLITIIESLAKSSRPRTPDPGVEAFQKKFLGRLHALSAASDLALASNYTTMDAQEVVAATLAPFLETESGRLTFGGPRLTLSQGTGGNLALGVHELATNAIKHGALSVPEGRVSFTWTIAPGANGRRVEMVWRESGGPTPAAPSQKGGYGSRVIAFVASREQGGSVTMEYPPDGYVCRIVFTLPQAPAETVPPA